MLTIHQFAEAHGLEIRVVERDLFPPGPMHFYADFPNAEVENSGFLLGSHGHGASPAAAIRDYASEISGQLLVVDAYTDKRREIRVPMLSLDGCCANDNEPRPQAASSSQKQLDDMIAALEKYEGAFEAIFAQCSSNPIQNTWGKQVDVTLLNEAHEAAGKVLKMVASNG